MPQMNLDVWFMIMHHSWFALLFVVAPKVLNHTFIKVHPYKEHLNTQKPQWNWPWT
uniref:ATP synthase complex subunit 8 n=3 Tax=Pampus TaxID=163125 RepID=A0A023J8C3_PAMAR|nr:ATP synthase F0 subunit 8 [Pampus sp. LY-2009]YP_008994366.1 ATP synthase F0 subunit 8 [Pampus echinogaster]YP_009002364.1 ATP synthase F0 subunit 8 [Pampus argenteus]ABY51653.1 ATP synthase F0 subunit 8 [Pampus sp. LY-2009]AGT54897.1 ATP synthase F0 subunit 8 [Pampus echinogaster]AHH24432.1 ATP synthase F0 subunit 8 [Pampus argenteus]WAJ58213.1 ATP synthase F0 subunit 8 [Pampus argenteus]WAJ58226.1 ATP synthase F0 subunit 8 [Pampus argenteus]